MEKEKSMEKRKPEELIHAEQLINENKLNKALIILNNYQQKEGLNPLNKASCHLLQCQILLWQGKPKKLIKQAEQAYKESEQLENNILKVDSLLIMVPALLRLQKFDKAFDLIKQGEDLMQTIPQKLTKEYKKRQGNIAFLKGWSYNARLDPNDADLSSKYLKHSITIREDLGINHENSMALNQLAFNSSFFKGDLDRALKYAERSLSYAKESDKIYYIAFSLNVLGMIYGFKGELEQSMIFYKQSFELFKKLNNKSRMSAVLNNLAEYYRMRRELDRALECIERSIALAKESDNLKYLAYRHDFLIQILIEMGNYGRAQQSLNELEQLNSQLKDKQVNINFLLDKALVLKTSSRAIKRVKAEEIFKHLLENENLNYEGKLRVLLNLCELLLTELRITNDSDVLDELTQFISQLLDIAEKSHSYWILCETHILQAKMALLSLDLKKARRLLTQGQKIAERYGLKLLAIKISSEHDKLLKQLNILESLNVSTTSLKERMELTRLDEQMKSMVYRRISQPSEITSEEPILLLITTEAGTPIFSKTFKEEFKFQDHLWSGFLTAFNRFSDEMLSEGLDRAIFGEYILIMKVTSPFLVCYLFKGQSYLAQHKIQSFINKVKSSETIWQAFKKFYQKNQEVQLNDIPSLEELLTDIFLSI
jgi:hypothetical protein